MGITYPKSDSPWMRFVSRIHEKWTHYKEMKQADELMDAICGYPEFAAASKELKYFMQFRQRSILYRFQRECILDPLLNEYTEEEFLKLPESFLFENCEYYKEYQELLKNMTAR